MPGRTRATAACLGLYVSMRVRRPSVRPGAWDTRTASGTAEHPPSERSQPTSLADLPRLPAGSRRGWVRRRRGSRWPWSRTGSTRRCARCAPSYRGLRWRSLAARTGRRSRPRPSASAVRTGPRARRKASVCPHLEAVAVGGASDGNFTAGLGTPTLDGLGAVGGGAHADDEHVLVDALPGRSWPCSPALVADLLADPDHHTLQTTGVTRTTTRPENLTSIGPA